MYVLTSMTPYIRTHKWTPEKIPSDVWTHRLPPHPWQTKTWLSVIVFWGSLPRAALLRKRPDYIHHNPKRNIIKKVWGFIDYMLIIVLISHAVWVEAQKHHVCRHTGLLANTYTDSGLAVTVYTFIFEVHLNSVNFKFYPVKIVKKRWFCLNTPN